MADRSPHVGQRADRAGPPPQTPAEPDTPSAQAESPLAEGGRWVRSAEPGDIDGVQFRRLRVFRDQRGWLAEMYRQDDLAAELQPVMAYLSQSEPGAVRGPHEHAEQTDHFVFLGPGDFVVYLWDPRTNSPSRGRMVQTTCGGSDLCALTIPPGVVHAYKNTSDLPSRVFNAPNRLYAGPGKQEPVDEIRHEDVENTPYRVD